MGFDNHFFVLIDYGNGLASIGIRPKINNGDVIHRQRASAGPTNFLKQADMHRLRR